MQQKSELPEGWATTLIGEICVVSDRNHTTPNYQEIRYPLISPKVFTKNGVDFSSSKYVGDDELVAFEKKCNPERDDILYSRIGTIGEVRLLDFNEKFVALHSIALIKPTIELKKTKIVYYFLQSELAKKQAFDGVKSIGVPDLGLNKLNAINILLPPLPEQHRIVSAIEALFARLDAANEKLDKMPEILKKFRESVLAVACDGRLTEEWRCANPDIENSMIFLKKIENDILGEKSRKKVNVNSLLDEKPFDLPLKWNWFSLSEVSTSITDGDHQAPPKSESGVPFIVISNISSGKLDLSKTMYVSEEYYENLSESRKAKSQDILYSVTGSYGIPILISEDFVFCFQRHIALIRPHSDISSKYLYYILRSALVYNQATKVATGIAQLTVPLSGLRAIRIPLPPLPEQQEIVHRVDALFAFADSIEAKVAASREKTEKLRQSILAKAFSGQLVETEAEIARREGRKYETAEGLLERIKEERRKIGKNDKCHKVIKR